MCHVVQRDTSAITKFGKSHATLNAYHKQHVVYHVVQRDTSAIIKFDSLNHIYLSFILLAEPLSNGWTIYQDPNYVQMIFNTSLYCLSTTTGT